VKDCKLYICTALFICITAVKLCFPESTGEIRSRVKAMLSRNVDYTELMQTMGRSMGGKEAMVQALAQLFEPGELVSAGCMDDE
jgi:hypothetical protein